MILSKELVSPEQFLGYKLGDRFTFHHKVIDYFKEVSLVSDHVNIIKYGETYEGRSLIIAIITHPDNKSSINEIRQNHLIASGLKDGKVSDQNYAVVWLSYSVHGNESSSTEAAMETLFSFANTSNKNIMEWLKRTVIIIDPCINPDGRDRYVQFYTMTGTHPPSSITNTREHQEPWPGGRTNHYYFDLNRDWVWQTQKETVQRIDIYNSWMPHIHVDYHEQSYNEPYYFAPAAKPYHEQITDWQRDFQKIIGKNHARYFDKNNWLYFTKEHFDLLYPGYGDTYPIYNGAIGMTYEKAGGGSAGISSITSDEDTLTLRSRINHHYITGISTVESAYKHRDRIIKEFNQFFSKVNPKSNKYKSYIIKSSLNDAKREDLLMWLNTHNIEYGTLSDDRARSIRGYSYFNDDYETFKIEKHDIIISENQKKAALVHVLFEPKTFYEDSLTYDITAWSIPYVYGLEAYAIDSPIQIKPIKINKKSKVVHNWDDRPYAYINPWAGVNDLQFLSSILKNNIITRVSEYPFEIEGKSFNRGSLVITRKSNEHMGDKFDEIVKEFAKRYNTNLVSVKSGLVSKGKDFGSSSMRIVKKPHVVLLSGEGTRSNSHGEIWHFFEQQIDYPISIFDVSMVDELPYENIDVLIMPNGSYNSFYNEVIASEKIKEDTNADAILIDSPPEKLLQWVNSGGCLIVMGSAMKKFVDHAGYGLINYESKEAKEEARKLNKDKKKISRFKKYKDKTRSRLSNSSYGSIIRVDIDDSHPLMFGYNEKYFSLRQGSKLYPLLPNGWNVGIIKNSLSHISGFMGKKIKDKINNNLIFGVHESGRGKIVYMADNPLFRGFWYNGRLLFGNAVFIVNS